MLSYCLKCQKNTESKNSKVVRQKTENIMLSPKCTVFDSENWSLLKSRKLVIY